MAADPAIGSIVRAPNLPGLGRVSDIAGLDAIIDCFESVAQPSAWRETRPLSELESVRLAVQTRVYHRNPDTGSWRAGRIVGGEAPTYYVRFPNSEHDDQVREIDLRVRWDRPVSDPLDVLMHGANESPHFRDARMPLYSDLISQRASCAGASSLLSSSAEMYPHQVRAALTVLSDPTPRYLLADEVGLGKTIEAGYIIRQTLLDNPTARVAVLAPEILRRQWQDELRGKFFIDDFPRATLKIGSHSAPEKWAGYLGFDLLVIDEAHVLLRGHVPTCPTYTSLVEVAHSTHGLLLLSATPALQRDLTQLALLHLLEPSIYRWDDLKGFRTRLEARKALATAVFGLTADFEYLLPEVIAEIRALLPPDDNFERLTTAVQDHLTDAGDVKSEEHRPQLQEDVESLRAHIGETYRLHRRLIRQRRTQLPSYDASIDANEYEVTGRQQVVHIPTPDAAELDSVLTDWLLQTQTELLNRDASDVDYVHLAEITALFVSRCGVTAHDLKHAIDQRIAGASNPLPAGGFTPEEIAVLTALPPTRADQVLAGELTSLLDQPLLRSHISGLLPIMKASRRLIVFCGPGTLAADLTHHLQTRFPSAAIRSHIAHAPAEDSEGALADWLNHGGVLIADESAEQGRNLQVADAIVHARLPSSPNQLEQRIGRVDRYGSTTPAKQYVFLNPDDKEGVASSWLHVLRDAFQIFTRSISSLQDVSDHASGTIWISAAHDASKGLREAEQAVLEALAEAQREVDRLDTLDASFQATDGRPDLTASLIAAESNWRQSQRALLAYAGDQAPGGLRLGVRRLANDVVVIERGRQAPLIEPRLLQRMSGIPEASRAATFNRSRALRLGTTRLFRLGNPLVDALHDVLQIDDRGQASAHWRVDRSAGADPRLYFGFDYLIEAELASCLDTLGVTTAPGYLRREADRNLPPFHRRIWVQEQATSACQDPRLLAWLNEPYANNAGDRNLAGARQRALLQLTGGSEAFHNLVTQASTAALSELWRTTDLRALTEAAEKRLRQALAILRAQTAARRQAGSLTADIGPSVLSGPLGTQLAEGIAQPQVRLIAVTCLVRASKPATP
jgi:ATP-dependent helicase HepA